MWREMLGHTPAEQVRFSDGTVVVNATSQRNRVRVTVTATLPPEWDGDEWDGEVTP